ncbi:MAG: tetratricopeptide repeat protein, partial [Spirochaetes bacterium]|nr:tetratricopeptide repeat protein [Spirochaetota bacterium]
MLKYKFPLSVLIIVFSFQIIYSADMIQKVEYRKTTVFYTADDKKGWSAYVIGKVLSTGQRQISDNDLNQAAQDKSKITVRLYSATGLRKGQTLFVINERNLIVSRIEINSIFKSTSFGYLLTGYGNFRRVQEDFNVVLKTEDINDGFSYVYKSRADYFQKTGNKSKSMQMYEKAIEADKNNATAHMKLGYLYYDQKIYSYAKKEFELAYESIWNVYDNQDKFDIIRGMIITRYSLAYESNLPA